MYINLANYRNRIGSYNNTGRFSYINTRTRKESYKSSTRIIYNIRKLAIFMVLMISIVSRIGREQVPQSEVQNPNIQLNSVNYIATAITQYSF